MSSATINTDSAPRFDSTASSEAGFPLSSAQLGIWFAQRLNPSSAAYNIGEYLEIRGDIAPAVFERALRQVVAESETLCVRITEREGQPRQIVDRTFGWPLPVIDLSSESDPRTIAETWMRSDLAQPVDPVRGPLFSFALFKSSDNLFFWYARYHHIVMDGFAMWLFSRRVAQVYSELSAGRPAGDGAFGSMDALLEMDRSYRASGQAVQDRQFWSEYLSGHPGPVSLGSGRALVEVRWFRASHCVLARIRREPVARNSSGGRDQTASGDQCSDCNLHASSDRRARPDDRVARVGARRRVAQHSRHGFERVAASALSSPRSEGRRNCSPGVPANSTRLGASALSDRRFTTGFWTP